METRSSLFLEERTFYTCSIRNRKTFVKWMRIAVYPGGYWRVVFRRYWGLLGWFIHANFTAFVVPSFTGISPQNIPSRWPTLLEPSSSGIHEIASSFAL